MKIFLSAVSGQFKACRNAVASDLRARGHQVVVQEDFVQHGGTLLEKLDEAIAACDLVIALVGDAYGWEPEAPGRPPGRPRRSYTQWEYCFAQGERLDGRRQPPRPTLVYFAAPAFLAAQPAAEDLEARQLQQEFAAQLRQSGKDYGLFDSLDQLGRWLGRDVRDPAPARPSAPRIVPPDLPCLCDREPQEQDLIRLLKAECLSPTPFRRPLVCVIHGSERQGHAGFMLRLARCLPAQLRAFRLGQDVEFISPLRPPRARDAAGFADEFREAMANKLSNPLCQTDAELLLLFRESRKDLIAPVLELSSREAGAGPTTCLDLLRDYWAAFPSLDRGVRVVCFVSLKFIAAPAPQPKGLLESLFHFRSRAAAPDPNALLQNRLTSFPDVPGPEPKVVCRVLTELESVHPEDVDRWATDPQVIPYLPHPLPDDRRRAWFGGQPSLPMDDVIVRLSDFIHATND